MKTSLFALTLSAALLSGCGAAIPAASGARPTSAGMRPATNDHRATPAMTAQAGDLVGRDRAALVGLFGNPAQEARDGAATRIQFAGTRCVLDTYLYAQREGAQPVVTHVDARGPDGADIDRSNCISALRRR